MTQRYAYNTIILCLALVLAGPLRLQAQERQPYTIDQIARLLESGVFSTERILTLAREACIAFRVDAQAERRLIAVNASEELIRGLRDVCIRLPQVVTYVVVTPAELTIPVNGSGIVQALVLGPDSSDIADATIRWSVEDTSIAAV
ncbi:MAG TPA: Ig-like domain-containing protein, partial [Gemmatimonadota bacterium]|nr:Ig-like domain-containing protein [Gemmatimonadota bacterium]